MRTKIGSTFIELAQAYLDEDLPEGALKPLEAVLTIEVHPGLSAHASFLTGIAYRDLDRLSEAPESIENGLELGLPAALNGQAHQTLVKIYGELGQTKLAEEHRKLAPQH